MAPLLPTELVESLTYSIGAALLVVLCIIGLLTVGRSVLAARRMRFRRDRRPDLYTEAFVRASEADPDWESFVASLSAREQAVLRDVLDSLLRSIRGAERTRLQNLGRELGIHEEARRTLKRGDEHDRRMALGWLVLLAEPLPPTVLQKHSEDDDARAAAARLLYVCGHPDARPEGTSLLIADEDHTMTAFGEDTLYRLHREDPTLLVRRAEQEHDEWRPSLLIQVLGVLDHASPASGNVSLSWLYDLANSDYREVRSALAEALSQYGHREDVRTQAPMEALCNDPIPTVRKAAYRTLATWGDDPALDRLAAAAGTEGDNWARLAAVRLLAEAGALDRLEPDSKARLAETVRWVRAEQSALGVTA